MQSPSASVEGGRFSSGLLLIKEVVEVVKKLSRRARMQCDAGASAGQGSAQGTEQPTKVELERGKPHEYG